MYGAVGSSSSATLRPVSRQIVEGGKNATLRWLARNRR